MKTLIIVRHAKSSWDNTHLADHDRPLLEVGKKRTRLIIAKLQDLNIQPDLIISSSAKRALETAQYLAKGLSYSKDKIKSSANYYTASATELMNEFYDMPESFNTVMLVGHNPTLTYLSTNSSVIRLKIYQLPVLLFCVSIPKPGINCLIYKPMRS